MPKAVATKRATLTKNCQGLTAGVEKFSAVQSRRVAAAKRPTTAGRRPANIDWTTDVFMYFMNILLMRIISTNDGSTNANVAVAEPRIDIRWP